VIAGYEAFHKKNEDKSLTFDDYDTFENFVTSLTEDERKFLSKYILDKHGKPKELLIPESFIDDSKDLVQDTPFITTDDKVMQIKDKEIWDSLKDGARKKWSNQSSTQVINPLYYYKPTQLFEKK